MDDDVVILAAQLTPAAAVATLLAAGLMISEGLRTKRLAWRPREHGSRRVRTPRRWRRG